MLWNLLTSLPFSSFWSTSLSDWQLSQQFFPKPIHSSIYSVQSFRDCTFKAVTTLKVTSAVHLLGCTLLACKLCACQASRPKKEPGVSNRDINGLTDEGSSHVWNNVLEQHPHRVQQMVGRIWQWSCYQGRGMLPTIGGCQIGSSVTRETSRGVCTSPPL